MLLQQFELTAAGRDEALFIFPLPVPYLARSPVSEDPACRQWAMCVRGSVQQASSGRWQPHCYSPLRSRQALPILQFSVRCLFFGEAIFSTHLRFGARYNLFKCRAGCEYSGMGCQCPSPHLGSPGAWGWVSLALRTWYLASFPQSM